MSCRFTLMRHNASPGETAKFPTCQNQVHFLGLQSLQKIDAFEGEVRARLQNGHVFWVCAHTWVRFSFPHTHVLLFPDERKTAPPQANKTLHTDQLQELTGCLSVLGRKIQARTYLKPGTTS